MFIYFKLNASALPKRKRFQQIFILFLSWFMTARNRPNAMELRKRPCDDFSPQYLISDCLGKRETDGGSCVIKMQ